MWALTIVVGENFEFDSCQKGNTPPYADRILKARATIAAQYNLEATDFRVRHLALLLAVFAQSEDQLAHGKVVDIGKLLDLDHAIAAARTAIQAAEPVQINISYAERACGIGFAVCPGCGLRSEHKFDDDALAPLPAKPPIAPPEPVAVAAPSTATTTPPKPAPALVIDNKPLIDFVSRRQINGNGVYSPYGNDGSF
jgi:hypothetical protein